MNNTIKLMLAMGCACYFFPKVAMAVEPNCNTVASCKTELENALNANVSNTAADVWVTIYDHESRRSNSETSGMDYNTGLVSDNMDLIEADYQVLLRKRAEFQSHVNACNMTSVEGCAKAREDLQQAEDAIKYIDEKAESIFFSREENEGNGYIWITQDDDKMIRLQGVIDRTIEKNKMLAEQKEEIDYVINVLGNGGSGVSFSNDPSIVNNIKSKVCTDSLLSAADESAKKAANVYGEMLLPAKYPTSSADIKLLDELTEEIYRNEIAYTLALSTYNLNRIAKDTDKKIEDLSKKAVETADTEANAISFNSSVVAAIGSEIIPLIVNVATENTLEAIEAVRQIPRKDVNIE